MSTLLRTLQIIHGALIMGPLLFLAVAVYLRQTGQIQSDSGSAELLPIFAVLVPAFVIGAAFIGQFLFRQLRAKTQQESDAVKQLQAWRSAWLVRAALLEGAALIAVVAYLLTGEKGFLLGVAVVTFLQIIQRPTEASISEIANSEGRERNRL